MADAVIEITGVSREEATALIAAANGDVSLAVHLYMDSMSHADEEYTAPTKKKAPGEDTGPAPIIRTDYGVEYTPPRAGDAKLEFAATLAWPTTGTTSGPVRFRLDSKATMLDLKRMIAAETKIPTVVQRIAFKGSCLVSENEHADELVRKFGFNSTRCNEIAVLYARRDEEGSVTIVDEHNKPVVTLAPHDWSFSYSIRELRAVIRERLNLPSPAKGGGGETEPAAAATPEPAATSAAAARTKKYQRRAMAAAGGNAAQGTTIDGEFMLVFNGLSMKDYETFGMCGVHGGAVISLIMG